MISVIKQHYPESSQYSEIVSTFFPNDKELSQFIQEALKPLLEHGMKLDKETFDDFVTNLLMFWFIDNKSYPNSLEDIMYLLDNHVTDTTAILQRCFEHSDLPSELIELVKHDFYCPIFFMSRSSPQTISQFFPDDERLMGFINDQVIPNIPNFLGDEAKNKTLKHFSIKLLKFFPNIKSNGHRRRQQLVIVVVIKRLTCLDI